MFKFCTLEEVLIDEEEKLSEVNRYKQGESICNQKTSKFEESKLSDNNKLLQTPPIYENVVLSPGSPGSNSFQVLQKGNYKITNAIYEDIRYKKALRPNITKRPEVPPKPKLSLKQMSTPKCSKLPTQEYSKDNPAIKVELQPEQDLLTLKQNMPHSPKARNKYLLPERNEVNSSLKTKNQTTDNSITIGLSKGEQQADFNNQLTNITMEFPRPKPRKLLSGSYVEMVSTENGNGKLEILDNVRCSKEAEIPNPKNKYYYIKDDWEHPFIEGFSGTNYLEIDESQVKESIHPIQTSKDVTSYSIHPPPKDELSDMLYEPVSSILERGTESDNSTNFNNSSKYYDLDMATNSGFKEREIMTPKQTVKTGFQKEKNEIQIQPRVTTDLHSSIFEDFSNNSELAKLGEKIRKQIEKNK